MYLLYQYKVISKFNFFNNSGALCCWQNTQGECHKCNSEKLSCSLNRIMLVCACVCVSGVCVCSVCVCGVCVCGVCVCGVCVCGVCVCGVCVWCVCVWCVCTNVRNTSFLMCVLVFAFCL